MDELTIAFKIESPPSWLPIGRTAENNWRTVEIDCSYWFNMNANGEVVLMYKPSCGMSPYPLLTERDGDNIIWRPKSGELVEGVGRLQAFFEVGTDVIGSSDMISCEVDSSLLGVDPGTDPGQTDLPWALDIIEQITELSGHYPKIIDGNLYIWDSTLNDWVEFEASGGGAVESVNGKTGVVVLDASDVGALPDDTPIPAAVTEQTVAGWGFTKNTGTYSKPSGGIPKTDLASDVQTSLGKADTALQSAPVTSVNNKTGAVTLGASDVHALPDSTVIPSVPQMATAADMSDWTSGKTVDAAVLKAGFQGALQALENVGDAVDYHASEIGNLQTDKADKTELPTKTSELENDSGYQTAHDVQTAIAEAAELPTVTASDNGKVLGVVNGAWAVKYDEGGASVTVDDALSTTSENPVQNKVVQAAFDERDGLMQKCQIVTEASENRWDKDSASTGLLGLDGRLYTGGSYDNYCYYNIGAVNAGDVLSCYKSQYSTVQSATMMRVVAYDANGDAVAASGTATGTQTYTVPSGVASVAVVTTLITGTNYNYMILVNAESAPTDYIPYIEHNVFYRATEDFLPKTSRLDKVNTLLGSDSPTVSAATLASGTALTLDDAPWFIKKNVSVSARMEFETFTSVEVGKGQNSYRGKSVIVDGTNITQVSYNDSGTAVSGSVVAHGLTISDYLQVTMFMGDDGKCEVTINTTSGTFDTVFDFSAEWNYSPFVVGAQAMTDVQLGFSCSDIRCPMWIFGDSYLGLWDNRVGGQLKHLGFFNIALIGVAGGRANDGSKATYPDLQRMLALGTPKYILWTLGMNGGDAANVAFLPTLIELCEDKGIELILYKVPHIPTIDHSTLNAYIESTGLRYIDACAAVGATSAGVWYTGMLSNDEVHPSALGAKAIAMRFLTDAPEIMQYGKSEEYATETWVEGKGYQNKAITDTGNYFTNDTVEGALQEIGAELAGVNTLIGSGVIS